MSQNIAICRVFHHLAVTDSTAHEYKVEPSDGDPGNINKVERSYKKQENQTDEAKRERRTPRTAPKSVETQKWNACAAQPLQKRIARLEKRWRAENSWRRRRRETRRQRTTVRSADRLPAVPQRQIRPGRSEWRTGNFKRLTERCCWKAKQPDGADNDDQCQCIQQQC